MKFLKHGVFFILSLFSFLFLFSCGGGSANSGNSVSINDAKSSQTSTVPIVQAKSNPGLIFCSYSPCLSSSSIPSTYLKTGPNTYTTETVYLYNNADSRASILKIQSTNQLDLAITNNCTSYLDPGKHCTISLNYNPKQYSANPAQPSTTSIVVTYSILGGLAQSISLKVSYICASPNLITVASPDDLTTTIQELDMDLNPNLNPYSANGTAITTSTPNSIGWNPGNTMPHLLSGKVYVVNTGNETALVTWPTKTLIDNLNVQINEGCQASNSYAYQLQPGSYCSLTYTYNPSVIPSDIVTNASKYIQTSNINYSDSESINSYNTPLKVSAYSTMNTVFSTMPDCFYEAANGLVNICAYDSSADYVQYNKQGYNTSILSKDTGLSPEYLTIPWLYYANYAQTGFMQNYFYLYNVNKATKTTNFIISPKIDGLVLPASNLLADYATNDSGCDVSANMTMTCWQPISYASQQAFNNCSNDDCMTDLQFINSASASNKILMTLPIKYIPQSIAPGAFLAGYSPTNQIFYVLTGKACSQFGSFGPTVFGLVNNSASDFCVENPEITNVFSDNNGQTVSVVYPTVTSQDQIITADYYNSACKTPAPSQTNHISFEYAY